MPGDYIPALRFKPLTRIYDPIVRLTTRESTVKRALIEAAQVPENGTVIDVGCGTGTLAIRLKQRYPSAQVIGLDADPAILRRAEVKARKAAVNITLVEGDATALPFDDAFADRVVSSLFFHHLQRDGKRRAFLEIMRVLVPEGELHIADWGAPANWLMRLLFFPVRVLDGFANTDDNVQGRLAAMLEEAGADGVSESASFATVFGTLTLLAASKSREVETTATSSANS